MRSYLKNHILPSFGNKKLNQITPKMVEDWLFFLRKKIGNTGKPLTAVTVNHCLVALRIMLGEAVRREYLKINPVINVEPLQEEQKERNILSIDEVRNLFREDTISHVWEGDLILFTINLLAASTGLRIGECQALKVGKVHNEYISVHYNWTRKHGLQSPKRKSYRDVPIPSNSSTRILYTLSLAILSAIEYAA
jgi:integrase